MAAKSSSVRFIGQVCHARAPGRSDRYNRVMNLSNEYLIAWAIYYIAGIGCCFVWWKITSFLNARTARNMLRGIAVVLIFTPWFAGETPEFWAPAIVVLLMDVLLEGTASGLKGGVVLLAATFMMLVVLLILEIAFRRKRRQSGASPDDAPGAGLAN